LQLRHLRQNFLSVFCRVNFDNF